MERDLHGTPVVPGVGWGPVVRPAPRPEPPVITDQAEDPRAETERLRNATAAAIERLSERAGRVSGAAADVLSTPARQRDAEAGRQRRAAAPARRRPNT